MLIVLWSMQASEKVDIRLYTRWQISNVAYSLYWAEYGALGENPDATKCLFRYCPLGRDSLLPVGQEIVNPR